MCPCAPVSAIGPDFALPNRSCFLQCVDGKPGSLEGARAVRRGDDRDHRGFTDLQLPGAVQQHDATDVRPPHPEFIADGLESHNRLFLVRLVGEMLDTIAAFGMVPNRSTEQDNSTTVRPNRPFVGSTDREFLSGETEPIVAFCR